MLNTLSGRFLILTTIFVMLAEILIFVPSVARFREDYLMARLERAQIASLALLVAEVISPELEAELLENAGVYNVVLRRNETRQLMLSSPIPQPVMGSFDLRDAPALVLIRDAFGMLLNQEEEVIRVIGEPVRDAGILIEVTLPTAPLRAAMVDYGVRILVLSAVISIFTAILLFVAVRRILVMPIRSVVDSMRSYAAAPEDARQIIQPTATVQELRDAEEALNKLQTDLSGALKQRERLAQLGSAVAKISHDLRNILTSAQLFTDRIERSDDPLVRRLAPKLVNSMTRAVHLCESTLTYGKAEEASPTLRQVLLSPMVDEIFEAEALGVSGETVKFHKEIDPELTISADEEQIYRVLANLIRNARQAIENGPKEGEIFVSAAGSSGGVVISVRDTGPGLPAKARENLFTAFQGAVRKGGTGLGLAIAAELVRGHGGTLTLGRSDETGTVFDIMLP